MKKTLMHLTLLIIMAFSLTGCGNQQLKPDSAIHVLSTYDELRNVSIAYWVQVAQNGNEWSVVDVRNEPIRTKNNGTEVLGFTRDLKAVVPRFHQTGRLEGKKALQVQNFSAWNQHGVINARCDSSLKFTEYNPCDSKLTHRPMATALFVAIGTSGLSATLPGHTREIDPGAVRSIVEQPGFMSQLQASQAFQDATAQIVRTDQNRIDAKKREAEGKEAQRQAMLADIAARPAIARQNAITRINAKDLILVNNDTFAEIHLADNFKRNGQYAEVTLLYNYKDIQTKHSSSQQLVVTRDYYQERIETRNVGSPQYFKSSIFQTRVDCQTGRMTSTYATHYRDVFADDQYIWRGPLSATDWEPAPVALRRRVC